MNPANPDALADALARVKFLETEWSEATDRHEAAVREQHHLEEKLDTQRRARHAAEARAAQLQAEVEALTKRLSLATHLAERATAEAARLKTERDAEKAIATAAHALAARAATAREGQTHTPASGALKIKEADRDA